jgi:hypothetical protein
MLDRVEMFAGRPVRQNEADGSRDFTGFPQPDDSVKRAVVEFVAFQTALTSLKAPLDTVNLISKPHCLSKERGCIRQFDCHITPEAEDGTRNG